MNPALIASLAAAGLLAGWPQRAVITRLDISPRPPALAAGAVTAVLFGGLAARVDPGHLGYPGYLMLVLAAACWLAACAVPLAYTDLAVQRLPDPPTGPPTRARPFSCWLPPRSAPPGPRCSAPCWAGSRWPASTCC